MESTAGWSENECVLRQFVPLWRDVWVTFHPGDGLKASPAQESLVTAPFLVEWTSFVREMSNRRPSEGLRIRRSHCKEKSVGIITYGKKTNNNYDRYKDTNVYTAYTYPSSGGIHSTMILEGSRSDTVTLETSTGSVRVSKSVWEDSTRSEVTVDKDIV